ncbi:hypothetical protein K3757_05335 [Sulfitobacter sp. S223]|uniref:hypothetical protein n=1 Tax=Sulfitobacter sp. S223 TaxID=2867023 RepID=UPI0021A2E515|nr:hypothetical protein [Sulfitobacter sp. S223]UWR27364.1 hypothetical protein K3757_05335 [Sulfitobacter sp. S223]
MANKIIRSTIIHTSPPVQLPHIEDADPASAGSFGSLYKHCAQKYLPKLGSTLRLGTLSEYRRSENRFIVDPYEGTFNVSVSFPEPTKVNIKELLDITHHTLPLDFDEISHNIIVRPFHGELTSGCVYSTSDAKLSKRTERDVTVQGTIDVHAEVADAYILCLSTSPEVGAVILDPQYDSVWSIPETSLYNFVQRLIAVLYENLAFPECQIPETVGPLQGPGFSYPPLPNPNLTVRVFADLRLVEYRSRTVTFSEHMSKHDVSEVLQAIDRSEQIKPTEFSKEREFRIVLRPFLFDSRNNQRIMFPNLLRPINLPFDDLLVHTQTILDPLNHG